jgi:hypothetical protein
MELDSQRANNAIDPEAGKTQRPSPSKTPSSVAPDLLVLHRIGELRELIEVVADRRKLMQQRPRLGIPARAADHGAGRRTPKALLADILAEASAGIGSGAFKLLTFVGRELKIHGGGAALAGVFSLVARHRGAPLPDPGRAGSYSRKS